MKGLKKMDTLHKTGVYLIRNVVTSKVYIGSAAKSFHKRFLEHKNDLKAGTHPNRHLQASWNKYGSGVFTFSILEICKPELCIEREQYYINEYNSANRMWGYNLSPTAGSTLGVVHSEETRRKVGAAVRYAYQTKPEFREKVRQASTGRKHSQETIEKMKASNTLEVRIKKATGALGKTRSVETRRKMSVAKKKELANPMARLARSYQTQESWNRRKLKKMCQTS
jgi:GIY-YIG catalytic domain-containing protein/NUMOD3 motif-containing protein